MSHHITTHDPTTGKAIFHPSTPIPHHHSPIEPGTLTILSSLRTALPNVSTNTDVGTYLTDRQTIFPRGTICPPSGSSVLILALHPGAGIGTDGEAASPMHRTSTHDVVYVLDGTVDMELDGGEKRTFSKGDVVTQRGTMHRWSNPGTEEVRLLVVVTALAEEVVVGGKTLGPAWGQ